MDAYDIDTSTKDIYDMPKLRSNIYLSLPTITIKSIDDKLCVYDGNEIDTEYLKTKHLQDIIFDGFILDYIGFN